MSKIQDSGFKTSGQAGADNLLTPDTQVYITANSLNKTLNAAITNGDIGSSTLTVVSNSTENTYDMTSTTNSAIVRNTAAHSVTYKLPTASAGKRFIFVNEQAFDSNGSSVVVTTSSNDKIYFTVDTNGGSGTTGAKTATLSGATYTHGSSGVTGTLGTQIKTQMEAADTSSTWTITFDFPTRTYTLARNAGTYHFTFATNTTNPARTLFGFEAVDGTAALSQVGNSIQPELRIQPAASGTIYYGNRAVDNPGYLSVQKRGVTISLVAIDSTNWMVERVVNLQHEKNTTIGISNKDISLVGRNTWVSKAANTYSASSVARFGDNYIYTTQGFNGTADSSSTSQYNDSQNSWTAKANHTVAGEQANSMWMNGYGYTLGGQGSSQVARYNEAGNSWTNSGLGSQTVSGDQEDFGMALNGYGYSKTGNTSAMQKYNDGTFAFTTTAASAATNRQQESGKALNGYVYLIAGFSAARVSTVETYNDSGDYFITKANYPQTLRWPISSPFNGYLLASEGDTGSKISNAYQYNDSLNVWFTSTSSNRTPTAQAAGNPLNGYGYNFMGTTGTVTSTMSQYN